MSIFPGIKYLSVALPMLLTGLSFPADAQQEASQSGSKWGIRWSGFVKNDFWVDTRQVYTSREDLFLFYPMNELLDKEGKDINNNPVFNFSAMTTRLTLGFAAPDALGAKISGVIEGDFSGVSNNDINGLRLRHAYGKMTWKHAEAIAGQYWHPLFTPDVAPTVASLNTGAPFQPFNRTPLVSITGIFRNFRILGAFIAQRDNANDGPSGTTSLYLRNAVIPEGVLQTQYMGKHHLVGIGGEYKTIRPRTEFAGKSVKTALNSYALLAFYKMNYGKFCFKIKGILGQNLSEDLMLGGYAVKAILSDSTGELYTPSNHFFSWAQMSYGNKVQGYLFGGYSKNLGTSDDNLGIYYGRGSNVAYVYRLSPGVAFTVNKLQVNLETEYTVAAYGMPDVRGIVRNSKEIPNLRILTTVFYNF